MSDQQNDQPTQPEEALGQAEGTPSEEVERTAFELDYHGISQLVDDADQGATLAVFANTNRDAVRVRAKLREPLHVRDALSTLYEVVKSDHRYVPKDRTAYLAYQRSRASAGQNVFAAQREYFDWLSRNDPNAWLILDPIITAHPDRLLLEVFSKDEGSYANLSIDWSAFELSDKVSYGTTNIDFSRQLYDHVQRMRSYTETRLAIGADAVSLQAGEAPATLEKRIKVPNTWLRGFLQVQASATLPATTISLAPIDLYNVLRHLRLHADQKRGGRAIRVELMPGETPRLVIEPTEEVITTTHTPYTGRQAQVIRIWGRRRWMMLAAMLPLATRIDLHLLGTGLPSFCVMHCGPMSFTLGLTGFTSANWSQALGLDTLLPRTQEGDKNLDKILKQLKKTWFATSDELASELAIAAPDLRHALQLGCQNGQIMYDIAHDLYRLRPLAEGIDLGALEFRNPRERLAHDLMQGRGGKIKLLSVNPIPGSGVQYVGEVTIDADRREYRAEMTIDEEGRVRRVDDTSSFFRKHQLKEGPSAPLIALRLKIAEEQRLRAEARGKGNISHETRTYVKRHERGEDVYQISLDSQKIRVKWGLRSQPKLRSQNLMFNSEEDARQAYFERLRALEAKGYMDATAPM